MRAPSLEGEDVLAGVNIDSTRSSSFGEVSASARGAPSRAEQGVRAQPEHVAAVAGAVAVVGGTGERFGEAGAAAPPLDGIALGPGALMLRRKPAETERRGRDSSPRRRKTPRNGFRVRRTREAATPSAGEGPVAGASQAELIDCLGPAQLPQGDPGMPNLRHVANAIALELHHVHVVGLRALAGRRHWAAVPGVGAGEDGVGDDMVPLRVDRERLQLVTTVGEDR